MLYTYAAVDLGASSGRVALGVWGEDGLSMEILHRFENRPVRVDGRLVWDVDALFAETIAGLRSVVARSDRLGAVLSGIGVDCWGVDYTLLEAGGYGPVSHYRDARGIEKVLRDRRLSETDVFALSGVPDHAINTSVRLADELRGERPRPLLFVADLWVHLLTGTIGTEPTLASTSQLLDARVDDWSPELLRAYDVPADMMPPVQPTGSLAGTTAPDITQQLGASVEIPVFRVGQHDTASAFAFARPVGRGDLSAGLVSSGTWSLVGLPLAVPLTSSAALAGGFTNERGVGSSLLLRNLSGMWLLREGLREWSELGVRVPSIGDLVRSAERVDPVDVAIDVADQRLLRPASMLEAIAELCHEAGRPVPETPAALMRVVCDGLSRAYATTLDALADLTGVEVDAVRLVGGGAQNRLLCQATADATGLPIEAGPVEASSLGNIASQLSASGAVASVEEVYSRLVGDEIRTYRPQIVALS